MSNITLATVSIRAASVSFMLGLEDKKPEFSTIKLVGFDKDQTVIVGETQQVMEALGLLSAHGEACLERAISCVKGDHIYELEVANYRADRITQVPTFVFVGGKNRTQAASRARAAGLNVYSVNA